MKARGGVFCQVASHIRLTDKPNALIADSILVSLDTPSQVAHGFSPMNGKKCNMMMNHVGNVHPSQWSSEPDSPSPHLYLIQAEINVIEDVMIATALCRLFQTQQQIV